MLLTVQAAEALAQPIPQTTIATASNAIRRMTFEKRIERQPTAAQSIH